MTKLNDFQHLFTDPRVRFKEENIDGVTLTIVSYMIADSELWKLPLAIECRGIVFDAEGNCVCRPFHKFFNINEQPSTQLGALKFDNAELYEKKDGSMVTPVLINDVIWWKTKKTFFSDVARTAASCVPPNVVAFSEKLIRIGYTPIFEFTHPQHQIVINYGDTPHFTLLAARAMCDGEYLNQHVLNTYAKLYGVDIINKYDVDPHSAIKELDTVKNFEGYVIRHYNGVWTKAKSKWYFINHHIMTELRERDIAIAVAEETVDDMKSAVVSQGLDTAPIVEIEHRVSSELIGILERAKELLAKIQEEPSQKEAALKYKNDPSFSIAMILYKGKEPNIKEYWKKHYWKQNYTLRVIYNQNFSEEA